MVRTLVLFLSIAFSISSFPAEDKLASQIKTFNAEVKKTGTPDYTKNCAPLAVNTSYQSFRLPSTTLHSELNNQDIELSVLSEAYAKEVFDILKNNEENSYADVTDGCFNRAHVSAFKLDEMGIISGKAFIDADMYLKGVTPDGYKWHYHVANIVMVKVGNKNVPTVFDPALFDKPVSFEVWKKYLLKDKKSEFRTSFFTKRFNLEIDSRYENREDYLEDEVEYARDEMAKKKRGEALYNSMYPKK